MKGGRMADDKQKILIVEDDLYSRELFQETLVGAGYDVTVTTDGIDGMTKIQEGNNYNLILLDAMMPKMDGLTFLTKFKESSFDTKNGPVILLTNLAGDFVLKQALTAGAKACLIKTDLNPDQLIGKVQEFLKN